MYAQCKKLGHKTNVEAEARAMMKGLVFCVEHDIQPLILETDSIMLKNMVEGRWETPWCISTEVEKIRRVMENFNVIIHHIYREGNTLADFLTNLAFDFAGTAKFSNFSELPSAGRRILNLDKQQIPNLRTKNAKNKCFSEV